MYTYCNCPKEDYKGKHLPPYRIVSTIDDKCTHCGHYAVFSTVSVQSTQLIDTLKAETREISAMTSRQLGGNQLKRVPKKYTLKGL